LKERRNKMSDVDRKPLREQIMFHLSFALMMRMSGREEMAQESMRKCQDLIELIPDITVKEARIENEMKISLQ
jgi:hypothetical protein